MTFEDLGLSQPILQALDLKNYTNPTPIQAQAIPTVLEGRDLLGIAQTGTGKTAAFMLPSIDRLSQSEHGTPGKSCRMLVLAPTRELAGQIAASARDYGALSGLTVASVVGGTSVGKDRQKLSRGVDILVATPGRLIDLIDQRVLSLRAVEILVLDEADQMLDLGFIHALRKIVGLLPEKRQTLLFSATMPKPIKDLAAQYLRDPAHVSVAPQSTTAERVEQFVTFVNQDEKQALLTTMLEKGFGGGEMDLVLVFTRTKHGADRVVKKLDRAGLRANAIHGNKSQPQRERALDEFRKGKVKILVATDIAARGIDIPGVSHVFNFELPNVAEQYVHRIGRTARAGRDGMAVSLCAQDERDYLRDIQRLTKVTLTKVPLPTGFRAVVEEEEERTKAARTSGGPRQNAGGGQRGPRREGRQGGQGGGQRGRGRGGKPNPNRRREGDGEGQPHRVEATPRGESQKRRPNRRRRGGGSGAGSGQAAR